MNKHIKTCLSLLLVLCLMSSATFAAEGNIGKNNVQPRYNHISDIAIGLSISLMGKATCDTGVTLYSASHSAEITMVLYRTEDGISYDDVKTWTFTDQGPDVDLTKYWYVNSGYDYIVQSWVDVYDADGHLIESTAGTSPVKHY